ncbi:centrosomal protein of 70 kDa isoform X2 [Mastacembelus armatus]|uniref:centrosomal protein of 70 kDa isoform X2 n=1 Tax=Mastacembelus armatus TaxID=205130 RepID=UPI000E462A51|nr:centrosomal protein of 70 kDa isoform X2 [Mastacembelus armatus]
MDCATYFSQSRNRTYVYLWTSRQFQQEQLEWDDVNKLLQHHGFRPLYFADPVENKNISDLVLLDKRSAAEIRATLRTMLTDSDRRQALIQELIKSNSQLKEEAQEHMSRASQQSQRATQLEGLLDGVKARVQDLEDRYLDKAVRQHNHTQKLQQQKQEAQKLCEVLEQKLSDQREEAAQLQKKLYFTIKEEERRLSQRSRTFQNICKRVGQLNSQENHQVLEVIDFYEEKMAQLLEELRSAKVSDRKASSSFTPSFKTILKEYQEQQQESKIQVEELKKEIESLKLELKARFPKEDNTTSEHIDQAREASLCAHYHNLLTDISTVVTGPGAPLGLHRQKPSPIGLAVLDGFQSLAPTLEVWAQQLHLLKELQQGLNKLTARLMPWQTSDGGHSSTEAVTVEDLMLLVDTMLENTSTDEEKVLRSPTQYTLGSMVSHFQKLFDVTSLRGVYPRMNEVYRRLGELTNAMRNIRDVLDLDTRISPSEVVNHVARLVSSPKHSVDFQNLLGDADIDSIIIKVKQHEEFFPAFHALILEILQTLGVGRPDDILPALRSLKQTAQ